MSSRRSVVAFVLALATLVLVTAVPPARAATRYRDIVFGSQKVTKDLTYGQAVNSKGELQTLKLDVHEPAGDHAKLRAAVVWVHGGYFVQGSKEDYQETVDAYTRAGFVTFAINYRLQDRDDFPYGASEAVTSLQIQRYIDAVIDVQHDAQAAIRWVRRYSTKYRIDPDKVAIAGHSAGGITAQMVNYNSEDPGNSGNPGWSSRPNASVSSAGVSAPILMTDVDFLEPPLLISHGLADDVVPFFQFSCAVALAMANTCEFVLDPDQDHSELPTSFALDFLYRHMIAKPDGIRPTTNVTVTGLPGA